MTTEIADAAIEAATVSARLRLAGESLSDADWEAYRGDVRKDLEAALPHLRAAILADLRERCEKADHELKQMAVERKERGIDREAARISGKAEGVRLALSYVVDEERMDK